MKVLLSLTFLVLLIQVSQQQQSESLMCIHCNDCFSTDRSFWVQRSCDDNSPPGVQTTPGIPIIPQFTNSSNSIDQLPLFDQAAIAFQCYSITQEEGGRHRTHRGCIPRARNDDETCRSINPAIRHIWCDLCDYNNCNGVSKLFVSFSLIIFSMFFISLRLM